MQDNGIQKVFFITHSFSIILLIQLIINLNHRMDSNTRVQNNEDFSELSETQQQQEKDKKLKNNQGFMKVWAVILGVGTLISVIIFHWVGRGTSSLREEKQDAGQINSIIHIWMGGTIPEKYESMIASSPIEINLLRDQDWDKYGKDWKEYESLLLIQKTDILRLLYLYEHGGIYHDFDVTCDYDYLLANLPEERGCYVGAYKYGYVSNSMLYCNEKRNQELKELIEEVKERIIRQENGEFKNIRPDQMVMETTGPKMISSVNLLKPLSLYHKVCIHKWSGSWFKRNQGKNIT